MEKKENWKNPKRNILVRTMQFTFKRNVLPRDDLSFLLHNSVSYYTAPTYKDAIHEL